MRRHRVTQISSHEHCRGYRKHLKRKAHRLMRRLGKINPEHAPRRVAYYDYSQ